MTEPVFHFFPNCSYPKKKQRSKSLNVATRMGGVVSGEQDYRSLRGRKLRPDLNKCNEEKLVMRSINSLLRAAALAVVLMAIPAIAAAQTIEIPNLYLMSSLLNFTRGQAVSIDFCNVDRVTRDAKLYFVDINGNILKTAAARVAPGQTVSLNFTFGELPRSSPIRVGVRGVIKLAHPPDPDTDPPSPDLSLASMQIYDVLTGKTSFGLLLPAVRNPDVYFPTDQ